MKIKNNAANSKTSRRNAPLKTTKHFVVGHKHKAGKRNKKLFSLQHQTIDLLRKADTFRFRKSKHVDDVSNISKVKSTASTSKDNQIMHNNLNKSLFFNNDGRGMKSHQPVVDDKNEECINEVKNNYKLVNRNSRKSNNLNLDLKKKSKLSVLNETQTHAKSKKHTKQKNIEDIDKCSVEIPVSLTNTDKLETNRKHRKSRKRNVRASICEMDGSLDKSEPCISNDIDFVPVDKLVASTSKMSLHDVKFKRKRSNLSGNKNKALDAASCAIKQSVKFDKIIGRDDLYFPDLNLAHVTDNCSNFNEEQLHSEESTEHFDNQVDVTNEIGLDNVINFKKVREPTNVSCEIYDASCKIINTSKYLDNEGNLLCSDSGKGFNDVVKSSASSNFSRMDFYELNDTQVLLTLLHPSSLYVNGIFEVEVLTGSVEILGFTLTSSSGKHTVYSPQGLSCLSIRTKSVGHLSDLLGSLHLDEVKLNWLKDKFGEDVVVLLLNKDQSNKSTVLWPSFVEKYSLVKLTPRIRAQVNDSKLERFFVGCKFQVHTESTKLLCVKEEWEHIIEKDSTIGPPRVAICGGKGVGKSTLLRYLINQYLSSGTKVLVIDVDPGQSEFTVPGCVSACVVTSPLLGPNFTHLMTPLRCLFFGDDNVMYNLKRYFNCVEDVIEYCNSQHDLKNIPWFINTMGFNKGIGSLITSSVIKEVLPTVVVQIQSQHRSRNFSQDLLPDFVESNLLDLSRASKSTRSLHHKLLVIPSAVQTIKDQKAQNSDGPETWGISSRALRKIAILSYFEQMLSATMTNILDIEPYVVNVNDVHISVTSESTLTTDDVLVAINGNLVALCAKSRDQNIDECLGFGIIRAVNRETNELFVLTPLSEEILSRVKSIVKGVIALPDELFTNPPSGVVGHVPYVTYTRSDLSKVVKKTFKGLHVEKIV